MFIPSHPCHHSFTGKWASLYLFLYIFSGRYIYLTTSVICFGISSAYHTFLCHSARYTDLCSRLDYVAIVFQILGSFVSGIYMYWALLVNGPFIILYPFHRVVELTLQRPDRQSRLIGWICRGASPITKPKVENVAVINICGDGTFGICSLPQLDQQAGLRYYYLEGLVIVIGVLLYADSDYYTLTQDWEPEDFQSETTSIASTIAKGRLENGRRYQAMKEDDYWSPSDEQQFEAFELGHVVFLVLDHDRENPLHHAPIGKSPKHILDIGTGKGTWAVDMADIYPSATVRGVDIFPPPVTWMPPNCILEVDDILRDWTWREPFDFIHMRLMLGAFTPGEWDQLYKQCYDSLTPGGWIEQMELDVRVYSDDGTLQEGGTLATWGDNFIGCSERAGRSLLTQETMQGAMEKAGFVDIQEKLYKIPLGPWPKDKVLKEAGQLQYAHWVTALEGWAMWLLTKFGAPKPWSSEEVQIYLSKVRAELRNPRTHAYEYARRVWARKPTVEEEMANSPIKTEPES
ncbi:hypothetical protein N7537_010069 [Penicillium hordei]|uniref:S-adenosyl-L-methionine-dependent methyltransferase n=1 Tax=Penicillium hordei TaxID=40994 RepID=A0AAD6DTY2_9EURO|nr:uncharacterized protein N7537_010069 [Penicillium hordei]KAJ5593165.1 hypothetical protein N7537_010069 [Penicillium hordei]